MPACSCGLRVHLTPECPVCGFTLARIILTGLCTSHYQLSYIFFSTRLQHCFLWDHQWCYHTGKSDQWFFLHLPHGYLGCTQAVNTWLSGQSKWLCAMSVFVQGIDYSHVTYMIHYWISKHITLHAQQSGQLAWQEGIVGMLHLIYSTICLHLCYFDIDLRGISTIIGWVDQGSMSQNHNDHFSWLYAIKLPYVGTLQALWFLLSW